jgi:hypothetical protein
LKKKYLLGHLDAIGSIVFTEANAERFVDIRTSHGKFRDCAGNWRWLTVDHQSESLYYRDQRVPRGGDDLVEFLIQQSSEHLGVIFLLVRERVTEVGDGRR